MLYVCDAAHFAAVPAFYTNFEAARLDVLRSPSYQVSAHPTRRVDQRGRRCTCRSVAVAELCSCGPAAHGPWGEGGHPSQAWHAAVTETGGVWLHRWGDAGLRGLGLRLLDPPPHMIRLESSCRHD